MLNLANEILIDREASKLLITNIKNMWIENTDIVHSRDSDIKLKTKDSHEYSYGADFRKMEPKIPENDRINQSPIEGRNENTKFDNSTWAMSKNKTNERRVKHNSRISSDFNHNNKVLLSKTRYKEISNEANSNVENKFNIINNQDRDNDMRLISHKLRSKRVRIPQKSIVKESINLVIRQKPTDNRIKLSSNKNLKKIFKNQHLQTKNYANSSKVSSKRMNKTFDRIGSVRVRQSNR
jgi:hypothetical protein